MTFTGPSARGVGAAKPRSACGQGIPISAWISRTPQRVGHGWWGFSNAFFVRERFYCRFQIRLAQVILVKLGKVVLQLEENKQIKHAAHFSFFAGPFNTF